MDKESVSMGIVDRVHAILYSIYLPPVEHTNTTDLPISEDAVTPHYLFSFVYLVVIQIPIPIPIFRSPLRLCNSVWFATTLTTNWYDWINRRFGSERSNEYRLGTAERLVSSTSVEWSHKHILLALKNFHWPTQYLFERWCTNLQSIFISAAWRHRTGNEFARLLETIRWKPNIDL